jgi:hypothetical protein
VRNAGRWLVAILIVLGALLLAVGGPATAPPLSSQVAAYLTDRNLALAVLLVALLLAAPARTLGVAVLVIAVMHAVDAGFDVYFRNVPATLGSLVFAILFLASAVWLFRQPATPLFRARAGDSPEELAAKTE